MDADQIVEIVERAKVVVWRAELPQLVFSYVSPFVEEMTGYPREMWYEPGFWERTLHEEDRDWAIAFCQEQTALGANHDIEYRMVAADGTVRWVLDLVSVRREEAGSMSLCGVFVDITDQKHLEEQRALGLADMAAADRAKAAMASHIATELRRPLADLRAATRNLRMACPEDAPLAVLSEIERQSRTIGTLIDDVVEVIGTRAPDAGGAASRVSVDRLVADAVRTIEPRARSRGIGVEATVFDSAKIDVQVDRTALTRAVTELLANAVKHTTVGRVVLSVRAEHGALLIRLTDTGIAPVEADGPAPARLAALPSAAARSRSLGLQAVRGIVESLGGSLSASHHLNIGTRIEVAIPVEIALADMPAPCPAQPVRALYVEDDSTNAAVMTELLKLQGVQAVIASDGEQGLRLFQDQSFDLVLMDLQMPGIGGLETARKLRAVEAREGRHRTPIVAVTAQSQRADMRACLDAGMDAHLSKPVRLEALDAVIERHLGKTLAG